MNAKHFSWETPTGDERSLPAVLQALVDNAGPEAKARLEQAIRRGERVALSRLRSTGEVWLTLGYETYLIRRARRIGHETAALFRREQG